MDSPVPDIHYQMLLLFSLSSFPFLPATRYKLLLHPTAFQLYVHPRIPWGDGLFPTTEGCNPGTSSNTRRQLMDRGYTIPGLSSSPWSGRRTAQQQEKNISLYLFKLCKRNEE